MNAPIKSPDEFAEAKRFLLALSPNGPWVLTTIHPAARGTDTMFCETIEQAMKFVAENNGKRNIYFTAQPVRPVNSKPRLTDATLYEYASVDIDKDMDGVRLSAETKEQAIKNLRSNRVCKGVGIPGVPTFLIDSGNGLQALWRLAVGLKPTEENTHSMKEINAFIIKALHGDKGTHNPIQLMRLPGTTNIPNASKRKAGMVECQAALLMETGKAYQPRTFQREPVLHIIEAQQVIGAGETIESLDALKKWRVSDSLLRIIEFGRDDEWQGKVVDDTDSGWQWRGIRCLKSRLIRAAQDRPRFEKLWAQYRKHRIPDLVSLGREVDKLIKAAASKQAAKKKSTEPNDFLRDSKGIPKPTQANIRLAIEKLGVTLSHNEFSTKPSIDGLGEKFDGLLQDHAITELWLRIDDEFSFRPRIDFFTSVVLNVCRHNGRHPVKDYLDSLVWDSEPRIDTWLIDYCHAEDTPFNRAVGRMFLIAAVRRIKRPGEKFDTMLILEGPEGIIKAACSERSRRIQNGSPTPLDSPTTTNRLLRRRRANGSRNRRPSRNIECGPRPNQGAAIQAIR